MNTFTIEIHSTRSLVRIAWIIAAISLAISVGVATLGQGKEEENRNAAQIGGKPGEASNHRRQVHGAGDNQDVKGNHATLPGRILVLATLEAEVLARKTFPYGLVSVEPNTGEWNKRLDLPNGAGEPTISRDGRRCFFAYYDGQRRRVIMLDIGGDAGTKPKHISDRTGFLVCGPRGDEVIISARDNSALQKRFESEKKADKKQPTDDYVLSVQFPPAGHWRVRLDDGTETKLEIPANYQVEDWSPDGERLVATSWLNEKGGFGTYDDLYLMRPDGSERRRLTNHGAGCSWPRFSSDGKQIAYSFSAKDENEGTHHSSIRIIDVASGQERELIGHKNTLKDGRFRTPYVWYHFPTWSPITSGWPSHANV